MERYTSFMNWKDSNSLQIDLINPNKKPSRYTSIKKKPKPSRTFSFFLLSFCDNAAGKIKTINMGIMQPLKV